MEKPAVAEVDILEQEVIEADNLVIAAVPQGIAAGNLGTVEDNSIIEEGNPDTEVVSQIMEVLYMSAINLEAL